MTDLMCASSVLQTESSISCNDEHVLLSQKHVLALFCFWSGMTAVRHLCR